MRSSISTPRHALSQWPWMAWKALAAPAARQQRVHGHDAESGPTARANNLVSLNTGHILLGCTMAREFASVIPALQYRKMRDL